MKRLGLLALLTVLVGGAGVAGFVWWKARGAPHIAVSGGKSLSVRLPVKGPHFMQNDPRWAADRIGGSQETLRAVGCTLCSVATAALALGEQTDPGTLNRTLAASGGYTPQGWLIWGAVSKAFADRLQITVHSRPAHAVLDQALQNGQYAVVKFILPMGIPHWAVVVGKEGQEYLVHDPLVAGAEPVALSTRASGIYSVRVIRAARS